MMRWTVLLLLISAGCGGGQRLLELTGEVKFQGESLADGSIRFVPANGQGPSAEAIVKDGKYAVLVAPGEKKIAISGRKQVGENRPFGPDGPAVPEYQEVLPIRYTDATQSGLTCNVSANETRHDFDLTSK